MQRKRGPGGLPRKAALALALSLLTLAGTAGNAAAQPTGGDPTGPIDAGARFDDNTILVGFQSGTSAEELTAVDRAYGISRLRTLGARAFLLAVPAGDVAGKIEALRRNPLVRYAEPNYVVHADAVAADPSMAQLWGLLNAGQSVNGTTGSPDADIDADAAWNVTTGTASVVVGVVDTGVDDSHPDLAANVWTNPGVSGCAAGTHGYNAIAGSCDGRDDNNHGTHVAGTIGAVGNNSLGVVGVNWTTSIMSLKFLNAQGSGFTSDAVEAIDWAISAKQAGVNLRVLNNSWSGGAFSQALLDAINRAAANDILFVAAAGNNAASNDTTARYPCNYAASNVVCVAATDQSDRLATFSNFGSANVDLAAPGTNVFSTIRGGQYAYFNGTSMATPHVVGAAALVLATGYQSVSSLRSTILSSVDSLSTLSGRVATGGRLNVCKAIPGCSTADTAAPGPPTGLVASGGDGTLSLDWANNPESDLAGYRVYRRNADGTWPTTPLAAVTASAHSDTGLTNGTAYTYRVTAYDSSGNVSGPSSEASATPVKAPVVKQYQPASYSIVAGSVYLGRSALSRLYTDDGSRVEITSANVGGTQVSEISVSTSITAAERSTLRRLTIDYNGNASNNSSSVTLRVFNWATGAWVTVNGPVTGATDDRSFNWTATASPTNFVSSAREIRFSVRGTRTSSFRTRTDLVRFTIES